MIRAMRAQATGDESKVTPDLCEGGRSVENLVSLSPQGRGGHGDHATMSPTPRYLQLERRPSHERMHELKQPEGEILKGGAAGSAPRPLVDNGQGKP